MAILSAAKCATCSKPCYPTERLRVSDLWVHKQGCLKCSECHTTLSLNSVYLAASTSDPGRKLLYCAKDVPKIVHTSIVDSVALKAALNAPNPTSVPQGVFAGQKRNGGSKGESIRFKGLTIRSKGIAAGLNAPKLNVTGMLSSRVIVGQAGGVGLDSWDIAHALSVQSQVSAPIRSHPAIHAQRTGTAATSWPMPSQPLEPQYTGASGDEVMSAMKGEEGIQIAPDMVKNLIKVFQLDSLDQIEVSSAPSVNDAGGDPVPVKDDDCGEFMHAGESNTYPQGTIKPLSAFAKKCGAGTIRTIRNLGARKGTLTLARMKGVLDRPALKDLFVVNSGSDQLSPPAIPDTPPNTPVKHSTVASLMVEVIDVIDIDDDTTFDSERTVKLGPKKQRTIRSGKLLEALLPLAAHWVPLSDDDDIDVDFDGDEETSFVLGDADVTAKDEVDQLAAEAALAQDLDDDGLELIMLFEEEPCPVGVAG